MSLKNKTWTTKDGRKTPVSEMGDRHLDNCIAMIRTALKNAEYQLFDSAFDEDDFPDMFEYSLIVEYLKRWLSLLRKERRIRIKDGTYTTPIKKWDYKILKEGFKDG